MYLAVNGIPSYLPLHKISYNNKPFSKQSQSSMYEDANAR